MRYINISISWINVVLILVLDFKGVLQSSQPPECDIVPALTCEDSPGRSLQETSLDSIFSVVIRVKSAAMDSKLAMCPRPCVEARPPTYLQVLLQCQFEYFESRMKGNCYELSYQPDTVRHAAKSILLVAQNPGY
jgi:hypothetical protein